MMAQITFDWRTNNQQRCLQGTVSAVVPLNKPGAELS
jgi:hypothetical protein